MNWNQLPFVGIYNIANKIKVVHKKATDVTKTNNA